MLFKHRAVDIRLWTILWEIRYHVNVERSLHYTNITGLAVSVSFLSGKTISWCCLSTAKISVWTFQNIKGKRKMKIRAKFEKKNAREKHRRFAVINTQHTIARLHWNEFVHVYWNYSHICEMPWTVTIPIPKHSPNDSKDNFKGYKNVIIWVMCMAIILWISEYIFCMRCDLNAILFTIINGTWAVVVFLVLDSKNDVHKTQWKMTPMHQKEERIVCIAARNWLLWTYISLYETKYLLYTYNIVFVNGWIVFSWETIDSFL